jgi:hypothetical protein
MSSLFEQYIINPVQFGQDNPDRGVPIPFNKFSRYTNYIEKGKVYCISGRAESGKTSFMDFTYMMNIYMWWKNLPEEHRPPLKMFYFNMKHSPKIKYQKWLCLYIKLKYQVTMDIPTLTNGVGRLFDLTDEHFTMMHEAAEFFREFEEDVLTLINGKKTPTAILNTVTTAMDAIGHFNDSNQYILDNENTGQLTFVYIDTVNEMLTETDGYQMMNEQALKKRLGSYISDTFAKMYDVSTFAIVPSRPSNSRMVKDSEPSYKDLGVFYECCDIGLVMYNAYNENNNGFHGYPITDFVINGKNRVRNCTIVRNSDGLSNITTGFIFLGECGYFRESPHPNDEDEWDTMAGLLAQLP